VKPVTPASTVTVWISDPVVCPLKVSWKVPPVSLYTPIIWTSLPTDVLFARTVPSLMFVAPV